RPRGSRRATKSRRSVNATRLFLVEDFDEPAGQEGEREARHDREHEGRDDVGPHARGHYCTAARGQADAARSGRSSHSRMRDHSTGFVNTTSAPAWRARVKYGSP